MLRKVTATGLIAGMALALTLALAPARQVSAQQGITWSTGFQVQNLSSTSSATISIQLIRQSDGGTQATISDTLGSSGSKTYFPVDVTPPYDGKDSIAFTGSAVVSSTQPVAAIVNILGNDAQQATLPYYSEAANGVPASSTSAEVNLPLIMRGNSGFNTWFTVQNAGSADAQVSVAYTPGKDSAGNNVGTAASEGPVTIKPGASATFDQLNLSGLGAKFIGSAKVTNTGTNQPLAVVVNQTGTGNTKTLLTYGGFGTMQGSNSIVLPLVQQANSAGKYWTGIAIQNVGTVDATVQVNYGNNTVGANLSNETSFTLKPGASKTFLKGGAVRYIGSATITTGGTNQKVVAIVNQLTDIWGQGSSYEGIPVSSATNNVSLPLLMNANSGWTTGIQCRTLNASVETTMTLSFAYDTKQQFTPQAVTAKANSSNGYSVNWLLGSPAILGTKKYIGSGTVISKDGSGNSYPAVCIVNETNDGSTGAKGDTFLTYIGVNY